MKPTKADSHIPENGMSATPRTDANTIAGTVILHNGQCTAQLVTSNFARTLETELAAMTTRAKKAEAELATEREKVRVLRDAITRLQGYCEWVIPPHDRICAIVRVALAATKEASK